MNPFDYVNSILQNKQQLITDESTEKTYSPFLANRSLSYHKDCIMYANEMNMRHNLDNKLQFDFLLNTIRSKKRPFAKWVKSEKGDDLECIKLVYGVSSSKAKEIARLLNQEQIQEIKKQTDIGGLRK
jgi:hypothetical protein